MLFWFFALLMIVGALAILLPSLLGRRYQVEVDRRSVNTTIFNERRAELEREKAAGNVVGDDYRQALHELERDLLRDTAQGASQGHEARGGRRNLLAAVAVALFVPLLTVGTYLGLGSAELATGSGAKAASAPPQTVSAAEAGAQQHSLTEMVEGLARKLEDDPENLQGWTMLGRSYQIMKRYDDALKAFARARELAPQSPDLMALYGETLALTRGGSLAGEPEQYIAQALEIDPDNRNGLWLSGLASEQRGDYQVALNTWNRLRAQLDEKEAASLDQYMGEVRASLGMEAVPPAAGPVATAPAMAAAAVSEAKPAAPASGAQVKVQVRVAEDKVADARPTDTVFVFARAAAGPRMPLAIVRKTVADLPLEVVLSDEMAMAPNFRLSNFDQVVVGARISRSGNAMPQPGDLEGVSKPLAWRGAPLVKIVIDSRVEG